MEEIIEKEFVGYTLNKYGEYIENSDYTLKIKFEIEYPVILPKKIKDFIKLLKDKDVLDIEIFYASRYDVKCIVRYFRLEYIKKILFKEYYLEFDSGLKIFYDAIFDFDKARRW